MASRVFIGILLANFICVTLTQNEILIDMGAKGTTNLDSYLSDLHVALSAVQYTTNMSVRMVMDLLNKLQANEVMCQCEENEMPKNVVTNKPVVRPDYRRTSAAAAHKFYSQPLKWNAARKACKIEGAELATIESIDEAKMLARIIAEAMDWSEHVDEEKMAFIGVHSLFEENDWVNVRGEPVPASWTVVSNGSLSRCATLTDHANLNAADCNQPRPYVCEIRTLP